MARGHTARTIARPWHRYRLPDQHLLTFTPPPRDVSFIRLDPFLCLTATVRMIGVSGGCSWWKASVKHHVTH